MNRCHEILYYSFTYTAFMAELVFLTVVMPITIPAIINKTIFPFIGRFLDGGQTGGGGGGGGAG